MANWLTSSWVEDNKWRLLQVTSSFTTQDISDTPKTSPLAYTNSVIAIKVPNDAVSVTFMPTTDLRVSNIALATTYDVIKANTKETIGCHWMTNIYIIRDSSDGSLNFKFLTLN